MLVEDKQPKANQLYRTELALYIDIDSHLVQQPYCQRCYVFTENLAVIGCVMETLSMTSNIMTLPELALILTPLMTSTLVFPLQKITIIPAPLAAPHSTTFCLRVP